MEQLQQAIKIAFASQYVFYIKAQNFHWNVEGPDFYEFHILFERIYDEVGESIDTFAEYIRTLQTYVPASFTQLSSISAVNDETTANLQPDAMARELLQDSDQLASMMESVYHLAEEAEECGVANFLADRNAAFRKHAWMLRSTLK